MKISSISKKLSIMALVFSVVIQVNAAVIAHDEVVGFKEVEPVTQRQMMEKKFQPYLKVYHGAVPFPAVDAEGNTGGGLGTTGSHNGNCDSSVGQVYSRSAWHNGYYAIMYAWYFPKDSPSSGLGHRHDWESVVVWLDSSNPENSTILSIAPSAHGGYENVTPSSSNIDGSNPLIGYTSYWPLNHQLISTNTKGGTHPLIGWEDLTNEARNALETTDFGSANVPFKDGNFINNLNKAWFK